MNPRAMAVMRPPGLPPTSALPMAPQMAAMTMRTSSPGNVMVMSPMVGTLPESGCALLHTGVGTGGLVAEQDRGSGGVGLEHGLAHPLRGLGHGQQPQHRRGRVHRAAGGPGYP